MEQAEIGSESHPLCLNHSMKYINGPAITKNIIVNYKDELRAPQTHPPAYLSDLNDYLSLCGGTITGNLTVNGIAIITGATNHDEANGGVLTVDNGTSTCGNPSGGNVSLTGGGVNGYLIYGANI